jgi:hypothetical protein
MELGSWRDFNERVKQIVLADISDRGLEGISASSDFSLRPTWFHNSHAAGDS